MLSIGVDRCKTGWFYFVIAKDNGEYFLGLKKTMLEILNLADDDDIILVDMPIGLPGKGKKGRRCDLEARKILGPRRYSVFQVPPRPILLAQTYDEAKRLNRKLTGKGLSRQAWNILPCIRELDTLMLSNNKAKKFIKETHPEVCFWGLSGGRPMSHYKKTREGITERLDVLKKAWPISEEAAIKAFNKKSGAGMDDILDAMVAAVTGLQNTENIYTLPDRPERDDMGIPMQIIYAWVNIISLPLHSP